MQNINLYLPEFQPNREPLRSIHILLITVCFIIVLALVSFFSSMQNSATKLALEKKRESLTHLKGQMTALEQNLPKSDLQELDQQILELRDSLAHRELIYQIIANQKLGNNIGFSSHLEALGRQSLDTISLVVFSLQQGGTYLEFAGKARTADQIPLYIQRLRSTTAFKDSGFGVLNIAPAQNNEGLFEFSVAKKSETAEADGKTAVQMLLELNKKTRGQP